MQHAIGPARRRPADGTATGTVELGIEGTVHPVALTLAGPDVRGRLPTFKDLRAVYADRKLRIPEAVIKERVAQLLGRMERENRLKSKDPVPVIIAKIFPAPGRISEAEFRNALDVADRRTIYQSALDAQTTVKPEDRARLRTTMAEAGDLIRSAEGDTAGLTAVFGGQAATAKARYAAARMALVDVARNMDTRVSTDYNLDDPEVGLSGWASHSERHLHLKATIVQVTDPTAAKLALIHEAAHLGDNSIDDHGYYGSPGFEAMSEADKVSNAAHYEELPRRLLGRSSYDGVTFTPGTTKGGVALTRDDVVRRMASEYARKAWSWATQVYAWLRNVHTARLAGDRTTFNKNRPLILEVSRLMDLTVHEQDSAYATVTQLDVTLAESITRGTRMIRGLVETAPAPPGWHLEREASDAMVAAAVQRYGRLLGDPTRDKALLDWLVTHHDKALTGGAQ